MWQKPLKKAIYTLNIGDYAPEITKLTYPLIKHYAKKIRAEFVIINQRKFNEWPVVYEKLQIYELAQELGTDWNIYIDSDALLHPDLPDITVMLPKDTVAHHGHDFASQRWVYDRFFLRDGRHIGSGNWFTIASDWCIELWKPLDDLTPEEAIANIYPTVGELTSGVIESAHLIDDYTLSRNIAKYGLKFTTIRHLFQQHNLPQGLFWHQYVIPIEVKIKEMEKVLKQWGVK